MTKFIEKDPKQLQEFLNRLNQLVDEFHPYIYTMNGLFNGVREIETSILDELNKD